ncbi:MAG: HEAT repeat domain-containing protein [Candidatus Latescibacteria bacterium]|jgi:HEAT repeat protein|nr:HEAT repeat domain-containing protein [Candidatus Latescibacterota bacterium]
MKYLYIVIFFIFVAEICFSEEITEFDIKTLEHGDVFSASHVVSKLRQIYDEEGEKSIKSTVPIAANRILSILDELEKEGRYLGDAEGEFLGDLLWILSVAGDMRAKEALLKTMACPHIAGGSIAKGLLRLGPQVLPDIKKYLESSNILTIRHTILTLKQIAEYDSTGTYFSEEERREMKEKLLSMINDGDASLRTSSVNALGTFGDSSVIPILEEIKRNDMYKSETGVFTIRKIAERSIERLKEKEK